MSLISTVAAEKRRAIRKLKPYKFVLNHYPGVRQCPHPMVATVIATSPNYLFYDGKQTSVLERLAQYNCSNLQPYRCVLRGWPNG